LYAQGTPQQREMAQDALNRWWWPSLMMLGPHDADSPNSGVLSRWGVKLKSNDEVRQEYMNEHVPELLEAGLTIPDADMYQDEQGNWKHGPIDWTEFWAIVKGERGLNKERLGARQQAHTDGAWVRDALDAYAARESGAKQA
ncbi:MAG: paaA, partial [Deinococcus sp.]|nr:paaA [Deinococcus sp.]